MSRGVKYPWDKWFARKSFTLVRGKHYNCQPHSMGILIRLTAAKRGKRVSVSIDEGTIKVRIVG